MVVHLTFVYNLFLWPARWKPERQRFRMGFVAITTIVGIIMPYTWCNTVMAPVRGEIVVMVGVIKKKRICSFIKLDKTGSTTMIMPDCGFLAVTTMVGIKREIYFFSSSLKRYRKKEGRN